MESGELSATLYFDGEHVDRVDLGVHEMWTYEVDWSRSQSYRGRVCAGFMMLLRWYSQSAKLAAFGRR